MALIKWTFGSWKNKLHKKIVVLFSGEINIRPCYSLINHIFKNQTIIHCEFYYFQLKDEFLHGSISSKRF